jgi:hypothetical protein
MLKTHAGPAGQLLMFPGSAGGHFLYRGPYLIAVMSFSCIDALRLVMVTLCGYYPSSPAGRFQNHHSDVPIFGISFYPQAEFATSE